VILASLGNLEVRICRLTADYADILKAFDCLPVSVVYIHRHLEGTVAFPGQPSVGLGWLWPNQLVNKVFEPVTTAVFRSS